MYISREIEPLLKAALGQFPVCLITGPRQAGKSTLLKQYLKGYTYLNLDDPATRALATKDPELFLSSYPLPLIIDEIQYAPDLLSYIKTRVDTNRHTYGQFVLTGSQTFQLMAGVSESLAGRVAIFNLYPLDWKEIIGVPAMSRAAKEDSSCIKQITMGFYPEFFATPQIDPNLWFSSYLSTYVERDVRNIKAVSDLGRFQTFIGLLAARAGKLLNMSEIGKECGITQPTVKDWLSILESTYIIHLLKPYHSNHTKRLVKSPKLYFVDTGLLCYLLGLDTADRFLKSPHAGHVFENMVVMEAVKQLAYQTSRSSCFFYRTASGVEVDLIIEKEGKIFAYEIKFSKTLSLDMASGLTQFRQEYDAYSSAVLTLKEQKTPLAKDVFSIHWSDLFKE